MTRSLVTILVVVILAGLTHHFLGRRVARMKRYAIWASHE